MKTGKKTIVIILTVLIVLSSIAAYSSSLLRLGVLNPGVYKNFLPAFNAYDSMYYSFSDYLLEPLQSMEIPEEIQGVPEDLVAIGIPKKEFNERVGKAIGGGMGWLLYNHEDVEVPLKYFAENMKTTIANDERVINSSTNIKATMDAIVAARIELWVPSDDYTQTWRGYVHSLMSAGSQEIADKLDFYVDVFIYYYGSRLNIITIASFAALIILLVLLILLTKDRMNISVKLVKVLCIVFGAVNALIAVALFLLPAIAQNVGRLASYAEYIGYAKGVTNAFGVLALVYGLLLLAAAFVFAGIQKKLSK